MADHYFTDQLNLLMNLRGRFERGGLFILAKDGNADETDLADQHGSDL
jgi:hypothetical protein